MNKEQTILIAILGIIAAIFLMNELYPEQPQDNQIEMAIQKGILFLEGAQLPSGEFAVYGCAETSIKNCKYESSPFPSSFIIHSLATVDGKPISGMQSKALSFILQNEGDSRIWRYLSKDNPGYYILPPDIDATAVALAALKEMGVAFEMPESILNNTDSEGRFYTWLNKTGPYNVENDVDCVVNANLLFYFSLENRTDEKICEYLNGIVDKHMLQNCSKYYPSEYVFTYALTRAYSVRHQSCLEETIMELKDYLIKSQKGDGSFGNDLETALAAASLLNLDYDGPETTMAVNRIIETQQEDGGWSLAIFYTNGDKAGFGSRELTTAFSLEAMSKYQKMKKDDTQKNKN